MEQLSDNNFDSLFKKAAEEYPLKTDNKNWDIVAAKLNAPASSSVSNNKRRWVYAVLLLLLLTAGSFFAYQYYSKTNSSGTSTNKSPKITLDKLQNKNVTTGKDYKSQPEKDKIPTNLANQSNNYETLHEQPYLKYKSPAIDLSKTKPTAKANNSFSASEASPAEQKSSLANEDLNNTRITSNLKNGNRKVADNANTFHQKNIIKNSEAKKQNNQNKQPENISTAESQHIKLAPQPKTFYGELFFAPNFSTVKSQHADKPGYKAGIMLGYRISKRLSAELGLQRLHNNFYSDARYLNRSHIKLKPNTTLLSVDGKGKLTEVPFDLKYNLSKNNEHFFVSAGTVLARITHYERYQYHATKDGEPKESSKHFGALTATKFFSDVNLAAGYQTTVAKAFNIRVEPYYQIPVKGLGVGKLPVNNFGINIGIVKNLK